MSGLTLSVIVPVYNEAATVKEVIQKLLDQPEVTEIVVVDDGSHDATPAVLRKIKHRKLKVFHKDNGGKGTAIRYGLTKVTGEYTLVQDADLEYDPRDIPLLVAPIMRGRTEVVFGSRFLGPHSNLLFWHRKGNDLLNFLVNLLYNTTLSDMETCYKLLPTKLWRELKITTQKFEMEPEITCKLLKRKLYIYEVPISYVGRDFSQGKKITWRDGIDALWTILKLRVTKG